MAAPPPPAKTVPPPPAKVGGVASAAAAFGAPVKTAAPIPPPAKAPVVPAVPVKAPAPPVAATPAKTATTPTAPAVPAKVVPTAPVVPAKTTPASPVGAATVPAKAAVPLAPAVPAKAATTPAPAKTPTSPIPSAAAKVASPGPAKRPLESKTAVNSSLRTAGVAGFNVKDALAARGDQKTLESKMQQMSNLTNDRRAARKVARNKDTIAGLMKALNDSPKFTKMVEYSVTCIKNLAVDVTSAIELVDEGVVESLLNVLNLNPFNERIQELVNGALSSLCMTPELAQLVGDKLGTKALLRSMKQHQSQETLVSDCKAMVKLFKSDKNVEAFVKDGAVEALAGVVANSKGNLETITAATSCLNRIADNKAYAADIMASGQVEAILNAMRANPGNAELAEQGIGMISKLAKASPEILAQLRKMGAVDIIVELLEAHPDNKQLIALGASALGSLADKSDVSSALSKITQGTTTADTASALSKLSSLMLVAENVDHMVKNEGIGWLISALSSAVGDTSEVAGKILFSGCQALMRCAVDESRIYQIMQKGGVKLLISVINGHCKDEKVACAALAALTKILSRKENAQFIVKSNGIAAALAILREHPDSEKAAKGVLEFFQKMAAFDDCVPAMIAAGVTEAIVGIMKNHSGNAEILTAAVNTLGRMATSAENVTRMATAGALETIIHALQDHKEDPNLAKQAILLLETTALVPANLEQLRKLGAVQAVLSALGSHPDDASFQALGARCMQQLQGEGQLKDAVDSVGTLSRGMVGPTATTSLPKLMSAVVTMGNLALVEENIATLIKNGAVDALTGAFSAAMKLAASTKRDEVLTGAASAVLRLAAKDPNVQLSLVKSGALKDMLKGALANPQNEELAETVMNLVALCAANPANVLKLVADGSIEDIVALAKAHPLNEKILAQACKALGLLATSPENILRIIRNGGAEVVVESIFANIENQEALMNALEVLQQLAIDEESINALIRAGAVDAILEAMRAHPNNAAILSSCMQALCRLLINEEIALSVGEKGGVPLFVKAMRQHYTTEPLCEVDMVLLDSLASLPENAKKLLDPSLASLELIKYIASAYPQNNVLVEAAAKLVTVLTGDTVGQGSTSTTPIISMSDEAAALKSASVEVLMDKLKGKGQGVKPNDLQALMATIEAAAMTPDGARTMIERGGLQALAAVMKSSKDNEAVFYAASAAFLALADNGGDGVIVALEDPLCIDALCDMMNAHEIFANPMGLGDLTKAIGCVAKLKMNGANVNAMLKNAPLSSLLKIFANSDDPILLAQAARLLGKLSNNEEAQAYLHKIVNIRELIAAMRRNIKNEEFLKYGAFLLGNLAQNEAVQGQIGIEGGIQLLLQIMEMYPKNAGLIENCVFALANLSYQNDVNCSFIVACRGIPAIITAVNTHTKAEELLDSSIVTLNNLCRNNDPNKVAIVKAGGAQAIVDTILNNFNAMDLLLTCFRTMGNLAFDAKTIDTIIKAGGVQGIVAGMTVHTEEADVIDIAVRVLTNMSADLDDENMAVLAQEGAVQAVVEVVNQYTDNAEIEVSAMNCLFNLARTLENAKIIIYQGVAKSCLKTMKTLEYAADVVDPTLRLLHSLTGCTNELERLVESGITAGIVAAVNANKTDKAIIPSGFGAIGNMSNNAEVADRLATEGPIECVLGVIAECSGDPEILAESYACLSHLTRSQKNAESVASAAQRAVVGSLRAHGGNAGFLPAPFSFIANLCVHKGAAEAAIDSGIVPAIVAVIKKHAADGPVNIRGLRAIENIAHGSQNVKDYCKREGLEATVQGISDANATKDDVRRACKGVLDALRSRLEVVSTPFVQLKPNQVEKKSLKQQLGGEEKGPALELKIEVKNFLLAGQLLIKHSKTAKPKSRHVYIDAELKNLVWKDPKKPLNPKNKMKIYKIRSMERGRVTPQLQRKSAFGKFLAKDECCLAIMGRERSVDIETKTEAERDKWLSCLQQLIDYKKAQKAENTKFDAR